MPGICIANSSNSWANTYESRVSLRMTIVNLSETTATEVGCLLLTQRPVYSHAYVQDAF